VLNQDFKDILSIFVEHKVEFLVVGAYALAAHGCPRATGDIDLWIRCNTDNSGKVWNALAKFGAPLQNIDPEEFSKPGIVFQIGVAPRRVDILTILDGLEFDDAWRERTEIEVDGIRLPIISKPHFILNKKASGRPKDLADIALLEESSQDAP
jgi:hypothetical protein